MKFSDCKIKTKEDAIFIMSKLCSEFPKNYTGDYIKEARDFLKLLDEVESGGVLKDFVSHLVFGILKKIRWEYSHDEEKSSHYYENFLNRHIRWNQHVDFKFYIVYNIIIMEVFRADYIEILHWDNDMLTMISEDFSACMKILRATCIEYLLETKNY